MSIFYLDSGAQKSFKILCSYPLLCFLLQISALTWIIGSFIMAINIYFLATSLVKQLLRLRNGSGITATVFLGSLGFSGMLVYLAGIIYLVVRKNREVIPLLLSEEPELGQRSNNCNVESNRSIYSLPREDIVSMQLPQERTTASDLWVSSSSARKHQFSEE